MSSSDHPTLQDKLARYEHVKATAAHVMNCLAPKTFGIHGDWGSGKTSFLRQMRCHMDGSIHDCTDKPETTLGSAAYKNVITIWFDAWRYHHESTPIIALLHEIRRQFSTWAVIKQRTAKLADVATRTVLNNMADIGKLLTLETVPFRPNQIQEDGENWERERLYTRLGTDTVQEQLENALSVLLKQLVNKRDSRVVVFIDDLDRCTPETAFRLLEGLKIYFSLKNCVFVIGMNQQLVVDAIATQMPREFTFPEPTQAEGAARVRAEAYLEKLCTHIERLVPPTDPSKLLRDYIASTPIANAIAAAMTSSTGQPIRCLPPNPRRIKALASLIHRWWPKVFQTLHPDIHKVRALIVLAYVYQFHSEIYQRWQFNPDFYFHIVKWSARAWGATARGTLPAWPAYFASLKLPDELEPAPQDQPTPTPRILSTYPDPYAPDVFWIAPLIRDGELREDATLHVMRVVTGVSVDVTESIPNEQPR